MKLKPFYQGKLDVFCAIYAVLNGLRLTHGLRTLKARAILNETLLGLATRPAAFRAVLNQETDYVALVDNMLAIQAKALPLHIEKPFGPAALPDVQTFWDACLNWMNPIGSPASNRAIIFRFSRHNKPDEPAAVRHWTTVDAITPEIMHLFDSSHEAESIQNLRKDAIAVKATDLDETHLFHVQPDTARFLRLPF